MACPSSYARQIIPNLVSDVQNIRKDLGPGKPYILWIGSSIPSPDDRTAEQIRAASYLAMMNDTAGIIFHMGHGGIAQKYTRHWSVYTGLSREVHHLFEILTYRRRIPALDSKRVRHAARRKSTTGSCLLPS